MVIGINYKYVSAGTTYYTFAVLKVAFDGTKSWYHKVLDSARTTATTTTTMVTDATGDNLYAFFNGDSTSYIYQFDIASTDNTGTVLNQFITGYPAATAAAIPHLDVELVVPYFISLIPGLLISIHTPADLT